MTDELVLDCLKLVCPKCGSANVWIKAQLVFRLEDAKQEKMPVPTKVPASSICVCAGCNSDGKILTFVKMKTRRFEVEVEAIFRREVEIEVAEGQPEAKVTAKVRHEVEKEVNELSEQFSLNSFSTSDWDLETGSVYNIEELT